MNSNDDVTLIRFLGRRRRNGLLRTFLLVLAGLLGVGLLSGSSCHYHGHSCDDDDDSWDDDDDSFDDDDDCGDFDDDDDDWGIVISGEGTGERHDPFVLDVGSVETNDDGAGRSQRFGNFGRSVDLGSDVQTMILSSERLVGDNAELFTPPEKPSVVFSFADLQDLGSQIRIRFLGMSQDGDGVPLGELMIVSNETGELEFIESHWPGE